MPIYAYKCSSCGHAQDVLQKVSDAPLAECPQCQGATFAKQLTAAGFQLRGSGWYATDFKGGSSARNDTAAANGSDSRTESKTDSKTPDSKTDSKADSKTEQKSAASTGACGHGGCSACS